MTPTSIAVGVMARAPFSAGKSRLAPHLSPSRLASLRAAMLVDTLRAVESLPDVTVFFTPDEAELEMAALSSRPRVAQRGDNLGTRMLAALQNLLTPMRCLAPVPDTVTTAAILIGSDIPLLTADHVREAAELLGSTPSATASAERSVVLGPADDGGYYLIGMTQVHAGLFERVEWGTESVLTDTLRAAERLGVDARLVRSAYDVDTIDDLLRLERDLAWTPAACPAVRRWFSEE